ncbi:MAG: hypothetical protein IKZ99_09020 [Salinivirgaceae bacterium]|nr:hypothetical protein [Salinivirgaceae bacterium]
MASSVFNKAILILIICFSAVYCAAQPVFTPNKTDKYNIQIDARGSHLSGMLIARPTNDGPRTVVASYIGPTLFDYTLTADSLRVNTSAAPLRRKKLEQLLDNDLRIVFIDESRAKLTSRTATTRKRKSGHLFEKTVVQINADANQNIETVTIKHPLIRLKLTINRL